MKEFFVFICLFFINFLVVTAEDKFEVKFNKCIDGDTAKFVIDGDVKTVRLLSINTPEIGSSSTEAEPYGEEASKYTCDVLSNASVIELQYDPKSDETDKYGRVLAWVFVDGELLQQKLISEGLAEVKYVYDDYLYSDYLIGLEEEAKLNNVGIWNNDGSYADNYHLIIYLIIIIMLIITTMYRLFKHRKTTIV